MREKTEQIRKRILDAALQTMCDIGYEGASTRLIAERAGISHPLMRYYFKTKEDLWLAMIGELMAIFTADLSADMERLTSREPATVLRAVIERLVRFNAQSPGFHRLTLMESTQNSPRLPWLMENHFRSFYELLRNLILEGQAQGTVRKLEPLRLVYSIPSMIGSFYAAAHQLELLSGRDVFAPGEVDQTVEFICAIVFEP